MKILVITFYPIIASTIPFFKAKKMHNLKPHLYHQTMQKIHLPPSPQTMTFPTTWSFSKLLPGCLLYEYSYTFHYCICQNLSLCVYRIGLFIIFFVNHSFYLRYIELGGFRGKGSGTQLNPSFIPSEEMSETTSCFNHSDTQHIYNGSAIVYSLKKVWRVFQIRVYTKQQ